MLEPTREDACFLQVELAATLALGPRAHQSRIGDPVLAKEANTNKRQQPSGTCVGTAGKSAVPAPSSSELFGPDVTPVNPPHILASAKVAWDSQPPFIGEGSQFTRGDQEPVTK